MSAKVRKLEIRPPAIFQFGSAIGSNGKAFGEESDQTELPLRTFSFSATSKSSFGSDSCQNSSQQSKSRRARSSENLLSDSSFAGSERTGSKLKSGSPFSFSLTTPTSSLSSFKHLETKSRSETGQTRVQGRRSLNSIEDHRQSESTRSFVLSGLQTNVGKRLSSRNGHSHSPEHRNVEKIPSFGQNSNSDIDVWIPQSDVHMLRDSANLDGKGGENLWSSKLHTTIENNFPDNPFKRDANVSSSFGKGNNSFVRNSNTHRSSGRAEYKFSAKEEVHRSLDFEEQFAHISPTHKSGGKGRNNLHSQC